MLTRAGLAFLEGEAAVHTRAPGPEAPADFSGRSPSPDDLAFFTRLLLLGQNVCAYGYGSKFGLINDLADHLAKLQPAFKKQLRSVAVCTLHAADSTAAALNKISRAFEAVGWFNKRLDVPTIARELAERERKRITLHLVLLLPSSERCSQLYSLLAPLLLLDAVGFFAGVDHCRAPLAWSADFARSFKPLYLHLPTGVPYSTVDFGFEDPASNSDSLRDRQGRCQHLAGSAYHSLPPKKREAFKVLAKLGIRLAPTEFANFTKEQLVTAQGIEEAVYRRALQKEWLAQDRRQRTELYEELRDQGLVELAEDRKIVLLVCSDCLEAILGPEFMERAAEDTDEEEEETSSSESSR